MERVLSGFVIGLVKAAVIEREWRITRERQERERQEVERRRRKRERTRKAEERKERALRQSGRRDPLAPGAYCTREDRRDDPSPYHTEPWTAILSGNGCFANPRSRD